MTDKNPKTFPIQKHKLGAGALPETIQPEDARGASCRDSVGGCSPAPLQSSVRERFIADRLFHSSQKDHSADLSAGEVAGKLGVSRATVWRMAKRGDIPSWRTPGGIYRFRFVDVIRKWGELHGEK